MIYGYARVSTTGQAKDGNSLEYQTQQLKNAGAEEIYTDTYTGTVTERPALDKLIEILNSGDTLVVTKLDRFIRNLKQGIELIDLLNNKGVTVHVLNMGIIDDSVTGRLIRNIMLSFAEWERDMIMQRTQEGKQIAKLNPNYREGRPKKFSKKRINHALELLEDYTYAEVAEITGISISTLVRAKKEKKTNAK